MVHHECQSRTMDLANSRCDLDLDLATDIPA
jgi:hypothetical protein